MIIDSLAHICIIFFLKNIWYRLLFFFCFLQSDPLFIGISRRVLNVRPAVFFFIKCSLESKEIQQLYSNAQDGYESTQIYTVSMVSLSFVIFSPFILFFLWNVRIWFILLKSIILVKLLVKFMSIVRWWHIVFVSSFFTSLVVMSTV